MLVARTYDMEELRRLSRLRKDNPEAMLRLGGLLKDLHTRKEWGNPSSPSFPEAVKTYCGFSIATAHNLIRIWDAMENGLIDREEVHECGSTELLNLIRQRKTQKVQQKSSGVEARSSGVLRILAAQIQAAPLKRLVPPPVDFFVDPTVWRQTFLATELGHHVLLTGPSGCGKTELVQRAAKAFRKPIEVFQFSAMRDASSSLMGNTAFTPETGTYFVDSRFVRAIQKPRTLILLDEINRCDGETANVLLSVIDGQRRLPLDEAGERVVEVADGVVFFATANIGPAYCNAEPLDRALADRFATHVPLRFPNEQQEADIIQRRTRAASDVVLGLVRFANRQRKNADDGNYTTYISTRSLLAAAEQTAYGVRIREALQFAVINLFTNEEERDQLEKLVLGMFGASQ